MIMGLFNFGKQPRNADTSTEEAKMEQQKKIGEQIKKAVDKALLENDVYNKMSDGKISDKVSRPIASIGENGDMITIFIKHPEDKNLNGGGIAYQIDIDFNRKDQELHVQNGPYGDEEFLSIKDAASFQTIVANKARECSKFPQQA